MNLINTMKGPVLSLKRKFKNRKTFYMFYAMCTLLGTLSLFILAFIYSKEHSFVQNNTNKILITCIAMIIGLCLLLCMHPKYDSTPVKINNNTQEGGEFQKHAETDANLHSRKFLQLVKLSVDISTEVLRRVVDSRILSNYGNSFSKFLDIEKHYLYHQWQGSIPCCECSTSGCTLNKSKKLKQWIFKKYYIDSGNQGTGHVKYNRHRISQYCLHSYLPNPILEVGNLDITILSSIIEHFAPLSPKEISALNDIVHTRNSICHAWNTSCFNATEHKDMWIKLSNASLILIDRPYRSLLKDQINMLEKVEFDNNDIKNLKEKMVEECNWANINGITKNCLKDTENNIISGIDNTRKLIEDEANILKAGQRALTSKIETTMDNKLTVILENVNALTAEFHVFAKQKQLSKYDLNESTERVVHSISRIDDKDILVDERSFMENINKICQRDKDPDKFMAVSAKQNCIILNLECSPNVLSNVQILRFAIKSFLIDIVQAGNIDTSSPSTLIVELKFCSPLTKDEIAVIKNIPVNPTHERRTITIRKTCTEKKLLSRGEQRLLEIYKVSSLTCPVLEKKHATGIIILAADSYLPSESDIEVHLYSDSFYCSVPPTIVNNNVIEFDIPWNSTQLSICKKLRVSIHDKKTNLTTMGPVLQVKADKNPAYIGKESEELRTIFLSHPDHLERIHRTKSPESGVGSDRELDDLDDYKDHTNPPG